MAPPPIMPHYLAKTALASFILATASVGSAANTSASDPLGSLNEMNTVLTPSRLKQALSDSPASTSIITSETIKSLGIRNIPEILRLVPGMVVSQASGNDYRVSYHGGVGSQPRRMQVLIDGASVYLGGLARVNWSSLPIAVEDIHRVEVIRNPSAASYGANAFQSVVNIVTKSTAESIGSTLTGSVGTENYMRWRVSHGTGSQNLSAWGLQDDGFDYNFQNEDRRDSQEVIGVRYKGQLTPSSASTLDISVGYNYSKFDVEFLDSRQTTFPDKTQKDLFLVADYRLNTSPSSDWRVLASFYGSEQQQTWNTCYENILYTDEAARLYEANPGYVDTLRAGGLPSGGTALDNELLSSVVQTIGSLGTQAFALNCGDFNQDLKDSSYRLEAQNTWVYGRSLSSVTGLGVHYIRADSKTYFNGAEDGRTDYAFYNAQYVWSSWTFNAGGMLEHTPHLEKELDFSYRAAGNWHIDNKNTLRIAYSNATRTPDLFESDQHWSFQAENLDTPYEGSTTRRILSFYPSNDNEDSEEIDSLEIAYLYNVPREGLYFQARIFRDELRRLRSSRINFFDTTPPSPGKTTLEGMEIELRYTVGKSTLLGIGYAYLDADPSNPEEEDLDYEHSGHAYITHTFNQLLTASAAYYGSNSLSGATFDKFDLSLLFSLTSQLNASIVISDRTKHNKFTASSGFLVENNYDSSTAVIAEVAYSF